MTEEATLQLQADATSPRAARRFIGEILQRWSCGEAVEVVSLLVTELTTNALLHARGEVYLRVTRGPGVLKVEVGDDSAVIPTPRHYRTEAETGRGLALVEALAVAWGVDRQSRGKVVWFEVWT